MMAKRKISGRSKERGISLFMVAAAMVVILGLAALAIDVCRTTCWLVAHTLWITHRVKGLPLAQHARPVTDRPQATG